MQLGTASIICGLAHLLLTVECIYFSQQKRWEIHLPYNFPLNFPFVQVAAITSISENLTKPLKYSIKPGKKLFTISPEGEISLIAHPGDVKNENLNIIAQSSEKNDGSSPSTKLKVSIYFDNITLCPLVDARAEKVDSPNIAPLCFLSSPSPWVNLTINENDDPRNLSLAFLHHKLCPNISVRYNITPSNNLTVDPYTGQISAREPFDFEKIRQKEFFLECVVTVGQNRWEKTQPGNLRIIDVNDNPPNLTNGEAVDVHLDNVLLPGNELNVKSSILISDADVTHSVYLYEIEGPFSFNVTAEIVPIRNLNYILRQAKLQTISPLKFEGETCQIILKIIDRDMLPIYGNNEKRLNITIHNDTKFVDILPQYDVEIRSNSRKFSRVIGPFHKHLGIPEGIKFSLELFNNEKNTIFGVTSKQGIVYVEDPQALRVVSPGTHIQVRLIWHSNSTANPFMKNSTKINVTVIESLLENYDDSKNGTCIEVPTCSVNKEEERCNQSCGPGPNEESCIWMKTNPYQTCVADVAFCNNGECDELEEKDWNICPQDCTKFAVPFNKHNKGIDRNSLPGTCHCSPEIKKCTCYSANNITVDKNIPRATSGTTTTDLSETNNTYQNVATVIEPVSFQDNMTNYQCGPMCLLAIVIIVVVVVIVMSGVILWRLRMRRKGRSGKPKYLGSAMSLSAVPSDYVDERSSSVISQTITISDPLVNGVMKLNIPVDNKWEIPKSHLIIEQTIGEGEFGKVMRAKAFGIGGVPGFSTVAVKTLKSNGTSSELQDLMSEYNLLKEVSHPNVIKLLGASTPKDGPLCIVVEYAEHGSLRSFLRKSRQLEFATYASEDSGVGSLFLGSQNSTILNRDYQVYPRDLLSFMWQISKGMAYLSDMKLVHRDLAARNILVATGRIIKISDFGLSRDVYEGDTYFKTSKGRVPVKWLALESLVNHIYTSKSDVWSFGIVMWEIVMLGATPYPGVPPERLFYLLRNGYRMEKPENCSDEIYDIMRLCWREIANERPTFKELTYKFDRMLQENVEYLDLSLNMVHNMAYFDSRSIKGDEDEEDSDINYGSLNILSTDDNDYLSQKRRENSESTCLLPLTSEDASECPTDDIEAVV